MSTDDSLTLARRVVEGDRDAVEVLLARHLPDVRAYVRIQGGDLLRRREETSDLVQSVCRDVLEHLDRFRHPTEGAFRHWLFKTALRLVQQRWRHHRAQKRDAARDATAVSLSGFYASVPTPSQAAGAREEIQRVEAAMDRLSEEHRDVIVLARLVGLSRAEIADRTGRTEVAVRALLARAEVRLADLLRRASS